MKVGVVECSCPKGNGPRRGHGNRVATQILRCCKGVYLENRIPVQWEPNPSKVGICEPRETGNAGTGNLKWQVVSMEWALVIVLVATGTWQVVEWLDNITN